MVVGTCQFELQDMGLCIYIYIYIYIYIIKKAIKKFVEVHIHKPTKHMDLRPLNGQGI
jgi:uncharacterized protein YbbC (DUF1343 family)